MFKLTMVSVRMGMKTHTKFLMLPVCPETGKVRVDYQATFNIRRDWCVGLGR
jgi:hypothetical protein